MHNSKHPLSASPLTSADAVKELERLEALAGRLRYSFNRPGLAATLSKMAAIEGGLGHPEKSLILLKEQEQAINPIENEDQLHSCVANQTLEQLRLGNDKCAMSNCERLESKCDVKKLTSMYSSIASALLNSGHIRAAIVMYERLEGYSSDRGNVTGLVLALANKAIILSTDHGEHLRARELAESALESARRNGLTDFAGMIENEIRKIEARRAHARQDSPRSRNGGS